MHQGANHIKQHDAWHAADLASPTYPDSDFEVLAHQLKICLLGKIVNELSERAVVADTELGLVVLHQARYVLSKHDSGLVHAWAGDDVRMVQYTCVYDYYRADLRT